VLFVVSGPSGVGKSTLVGRVLGNVPGLGFSVSATTRAPRPGEVDGVHYHFIDAGSFDARVAAGEFLEHATVYGRHYGTLRAPTADALSAGRSLLLDIDVQGFRQLRSAWPEAVSVFILPPDLPTLEARLRSRSTDSEEVIHRRMRDADEQIAGCGEYDYVVVNGDLESAATVMRAIFLAELSRVRRQQRVVTSLIDAALAYDRSNGG
jgi:guanylate kinase